MQIHVLISYCTSALIPTQLSKSIDTARIGSTIRRLIPSPRTGQYRLHSPNPVVGGRQPVQKPRFDPIPCPQLGFCRQATGHCRQAIGFRSPQLFLSLFELFVLALEQAFHVRKTVLKCTKQFLRWRLVGGLEKSPSAKFHENIISLCDLKRPSIVSSCTYREPRLGSV